MKKFILFFLTLVIYFNASSHFVARMEVKEPIPGACNEKEVYVMFPGFKGQKEAVWPLSKKEIINKLNEEVIYLQNNPSYTDKGMIGLVINCKNELVQCKMDNKTKDPVLDAQIEAVFKSLGKWKSGKLDGKEVDTSVLFSFSIKDGKFTLD